MAQCWFDSFEIGQRSSVVGRRQGRQRWSLPAIPVQYFQETRDGVHLRDCEQRSDHVRQDRTNTRPPVHRVEYVRFPGDYFGDNLGKNKGRLNDGRSSCIVVQPRMWCHDCSCYQLDCWSLSERRGSSPVESRFEHRCDRQLSPWNPGTGNWVWTPQSPLRISCGHRSVSDPRHVEGGRRVLGENG